MISRMMMTWKHSNRRLQNEEEVEEKDRVILRNSPRKKFQVRARRVPLPPKPSSRERRPKVSGHSSKAAAKRKRASAKSADFADGDQDD